jgi:hypothetical protein
MTVRAHRAHRASPGTALRCARPRERSTDWRVAIAADGAPERRGGGPAGPSRVPRPPAEPQRPADGGRHPRSPGPAWHPVVLVSFASFPCQSTPANSYATNRITHLMPHAQFTACASRCGCNFFPPRRVPSGETDGQIRRLGQLPAAPDSGAEARAGVCPACRILNPPDCPGGREEEVRGFASPLSQ